MYEHNGKLIVRTAAGSFIGVVVKVTGEGSYDVLPTSDRYDSRPAGATPTSVDQIIRKHQLQVGDYYPVIAVKPTADVKSRSHSTKI